MVLLEFQAPNGHLWRLVTDRLPDESHYELIKCSCGGDPQPEPSYAGATGLLIRKGFVRATPIEGPIPGDGHPLSQEPPGALGLVVITMRDAFTGL